MAKKKATKKATKKPAARKAPKGAIVVESPDGSKWALEITNEGKVEPQRL